MAELAHFVDVASRVLAAADAASRDDPPRHQPGRLLRATDADALRVDLGARILLVISRGGSGTSRAALSGAGQVSTVLEPIEAEPLWRACAAVLAALPDDPPYPTEISP
jgi:hypothetical protein